MKCSECGKEVENRFNASTSKKLTERKLCFTCNHFFELRDLNGVLIREKDGRLHHYMIGPEDQDDNRLSGFNGRRFKIEFFDGRVVETTNLWHQGDISSHLEKWFEENAKFIPV
jgi:hypothetical protein